MERMRFLVLGFFLFTMFSTYGQQQVMFTQYMFNGLALNPAYAGSHETISLTAVAREQWSGFEGAPNTQTFSVHSPAFTKNIGLGFLFVHDKIGVTEQTGAYASYAYRIRFKNQATLAFGIQGGLSYYLARYSEVSQTNPAFASGDINEIQPNFGAGLYYYSDRFYFGLSVPQLIESYLDRQNIDSDSRIVRHYFLSTGYVFDLSHSLKLKPNMLIKAVEGAPVEFDINANLLINEVVWVGLSWRSFDSIDALLQLQVTNRLQLGYAYDFATTTDLRRINVGSHEVVLNYKFTFNNTKIITPRYF